MTVRKHKIFLHLPNNLNRRQMLYLDGIRYSVQIAEAAYERLKKTLLNLTIRTLQKKKVSIGQLTLKSVTDSWTIIDSIHRFVGLLKQLPGMKQNTAALVSFYRQAENVENLRNLTQHINQEITRSLVDKKIPVWGTLNWVVIPDPKSEKCYSCSLTPGTIFGRIMPIYNPVGKCINTPIDGIEIHTTDTVNISRLMTRVEKITLSIENQLKKQFKGHPQAGSDLFVLLEIAPGSPVVK